MTSRMSTTRQASPAQVAAQLRETITRLNRRLRQTRPIEDITVAQISALLSLDAAGALTPRELAEVERVQPPTITRIVARLEERDLVQRTPHPTDGRQAILAASPAGRELIAEYRRARDEWLTRRLAKLGAEERETVLRAARILSRIVHD